MNNTYIELLLEDKTTGSNIRWATDLYSGLGPKYEPQHAISAEQVQRVIVPRTEKSEEEQSKRTKDQAEVFTPSWVVNEQLSLIDNAWFKRNGVFNIICKNGWRTNRVRITFPTDKTWKDYVCFKYLEVSCGEGPYLVSPYDPTTGRKIQFDDRVGALDRKLRVVNENTTEEDEWIEWAKKSLQSTYGYEYQGDNLFIARYNVLRTIIDYHFNRFNKPLDDAQIKQMANVICWNLWQMDGLTMTSPFSEKEPEASQVSLFSDEPVIMEPIYSKTFDWKRRRSVEFRKLVKEG